MRHYLLTALLAATVVAGCGGDATSTTNSTPDASTHLVDVGIGRQFEVPPASPGAGIETYSNTVFNFSIQFPANEFALFDPPQYVTVLGNRVFEFVSRTLPEGEIFRPNVGLIVDPRFQGRVNIEAYADAAPPILGEFFVDFNLVDRRSFTIDGRQAVLLEHVSSWAAPDGTIVPFHRYTLYTVNRDDIILIFTFTTPTGVFETYRPTFEQMIESIDLL